MDLVSNKIGRNDNVRYDPLKRKWEAHACKSPGKVLARAQAYLKSLPALVGTGPFAAVILDLQTSQFRGFTGNFKEIFAMDYRENINTSDLIPLIYPRHLSFTTRHFAAYLDYIIPLSLEERNRVDLSIVYKYLRNNRYRWLNIRVFKYFSNSDKNLGYAILEYTDITQVKSDNLAKFIMYDNRKGYIINEVLLPDCPLPGRLTPSELAVTKLISQGLSDKEIACMRSCAIGTVKQHKKNIFAKLKINKSIELVRLAYDCGLVTDPVKANS